MLTNKQRDAIMNRTDCLKDLAIQQGYHYALEHKEQVRFLELRMKVVRKQLKTLLKTMK